MRDKADIEKSRERARIASISTTEAGNIIQNDILIELLLDIRDLLIISYEPTIITEGHGGDGNIGGKGGAY